MKQNLLTNEASDHRQAEQILSAVLNTVGEGIIVLTEVGKIVMINQVILQIWDYQPEDKSALIGQSLQSLLSEKDSETTLSYLLNRQVELKGHKKDGQIFPIKIHLTQTNLDGQWLYIAAIRDISERYNIEKIQQNFISTISHELRTLLTSIIGFLQTVLSERLGPLTDIQKRFLGNSYHNAERLHRLIEELLLIANLQRDLLNSNKRPFQPPMLVQALYDKFLIIAEAKSITLTLQNDWPADKQMQGNPEQLEQVLKHLLDNATKFTPSQGYIQIRSYYQAASWVVTIQDTGIGIPEEERSQVFQRFYRASNAAEEQIEGIGLGLYVCQEIIQHHGGQIGVGTDGVNNTISLYDASPSTTVWFKVPLNCP